MSRRVCVLATVHRPFDARIFHKQAKTLVGLGTMWAVRVASDVFRPSSFPVSCPVPWNVADKLRHYRMGPNLVL